MTDPTPRGPRLRLVCINDVYTLENLPRLRTLVAHHANTDPADLLLTTLAGDFVGPSMLSSLDAGRGMIDCMNAIPITHVTFGNHEDDIPLEELRGRVAEFRGTWLDTNVRDFQPALPAFQIVEVAGKGTRTVRVGLIGVVMEDGTVYRRPPFGGAAVSPANEAAMRETARLLSERACACVVPLTHQSIEHDRELARAQRQPPFPVIVGGHEHQSFLEEIGGTWIVKAGSDATHAVIVDLEWPATASRDGVYDAPSVRVRLEAVAAYAEDPDPRARVDRHMRAVHELESATLMKLAPGESLSSVGTRAHQTTLGTLICSRVRDALGAEACLFNGGGIRAQRDYSERFTYGDLKAELPFDNEVVVASLPGRVVREAVSASRAHAPVESGAFLQVDDRTVVDGGTVTTIAGAPLDEARSYRVAVVRNFFAGMDHIEPLIRFASEHPECIPAPGSGRDVKMILVESFARRLWRSLGSFDALDANHDGRVSHDEIAVALSRAIHEPASDVTVGLMERVADKDHDQSITRDEVEAAERDDEH